MIPMDQWEWFGCAGHFICADRCRFHLCTKIRDLLVSTVGEYFPDEGVREGLAKMRGVTLVGIGDYRAADYMDKVGFEKIGSNRLYETMVFKAGAPCTDKDCNCGCPTITPVIELDGKGYNLRGEANRGHMEMCYKVAAGTLSN